MHALISSQVDYCNSVFSKLPSYLIQKLQRLQNLAARTINRTPKTDHISSTLYALHVHWLPIDKRIQYELLLMVLKGLNGLFPSYELLLMVLKGLNGLFPSYLSELIVNYKPKRKLRSA